MFSKCELMRSATIFPVHRRFGASFIEIMVVTGIVGTAVSIMVPAIQSGREIARRQTCVSNIRQVTQGVLTFEALRGALPPGGWLAPQSNSQAKVSAPASIALPQGSTNGQSAV